VRRLVSEGSRPRLPWGLQLKPLIADPAPTLPLLRVLQDDTSAYVRRSVANHLNDIAKDHPRRLADWLQEHLRDASDQRRALLRHASRTLIKNGDPRVLTLWGLGTAFAGEAELLLQQSQLRIGETLGLQIRLRSTANCAQRLAIDYIIHHVKANGASSGKTFKGRQLELSAGASHTLVKTHSFRPITTRRYYPGQHRVEVQVNGAIVASASFRLTE
jgi:hypothetical protein